jgi:signal transduction histidine kinase
MRYEKRLEILHKLDRALLAAQSPAAIGQAAVAHIGQVIPCRRATVSIFDFEAGESVVQAVHATGETRLGMGERLPLDAFGSLDALREGNVTIVADARALPDKGVFDLLREEGLCSWLNVPLIAQGELIGTLNVGSECVNVFSSEDVDAAREVADSLAIAMQQAQLHNQVQQRMAELERRVAERTAELEAFSYSVSHDLRAPLRAIDGFSRVLLEDYDSKLDDECRRLLHIICSNARIMGQLIDDLLALSRLGRQNMELTDIDIAELARSVLRELGVSELQRKVEFHIGALPPARGDATMIRRVLANLLSNGIKFTGLKDSPRIEIGYQSEDNETTYYVMDNGVGFHMRYAKKMFGVFQRLHGTDEFEGTGMGLAIVQLIIRRHGGRVWAEGKRDEGATIYFTLPPGASKKWSMSIQ